MAREIPVYLFTGFLESGKTRFIQETLEDPEFDKGECTLVIQCEEGEEEIDPKKCPFGNVHVEVIDDERKINPVNLDRLVQKHNADRIMIEYNGMWLLDKLFQAMPEGWLIYQEFSFADTNTFLAYNANMRQLVYDKLKSCDCMVFNRFSEDTDKMELHKIVRAVSRRADIFYEYPTGDADIDDIEDPLPFDVNAPVIEIEDNDYALWYRDLDEKMGEYEGKTVKFKGVCGNSAALKGSDFVIGRQLMTCCVEDIRMAGLVCEWKGQKPDTGRWAVITAKIAIKKNPAYGSKPGPVLIVSDIVPAKEPEQPVATFY